MTQTQYDMGAPLAIKGFTVAILGGLGNSMAAVAAGLLLGLLEAFSVSQLPAGLQGGRVPRRCCWSSCSCGPSGLFARRDVQSAEGSLMRLRCTCPSRRGWRWSWSRCSSPCGGRRDATT